MLDVSNKHRGISFIAHDTSLRSTGVSCQGLNDSVQLSLARIVQLKQGETFKGQPNIIRPHQGDWQQACLLEKDWANQAFPMVDSPLWAEELDVFAAVGWPVPRWDYWNRMGEKAKQNMDASLIGLWNFQVPGTTWTVAHPNPIMGDEEDLHFAVRDVHRQGIRLVMYIQSLLVNRFAEGCNPKDMVGYMKRNFLWKGWELPETGFAENCRIRNASGKSIPYNSHSTDSETCMNQANSEVRKFKYRWAIELLGRKLGIDGIYWDSDSGGFGQPAWGNSNLYGSDPGFPGKGAYETAKLIRHDFKKIDPECVFIGEGPPNAMMGGVRDFSLDNVRSLWPIRMLFPRMKLLSGSANRNDPTREKAFLSGARFDGIDLKEALQKTFVWMRKRVKQYLYRAIFLNELGMKINGTGIEAKLLELDSRDGKGFIINILNRQQIANASIELSPSTENILNHGWLIDSEKQDKVFSDFTRDNHNRYRIKIPRAAASHIIFFSQLQPRVTVLTKGDFSAGNSHQVQVKLESLDGQSKQGKLNLTTPEFFKSEPIEYHINPDKPGDGNIYNIPLEIDLEAPAKIVDLPLEITPYKGTKFRKCITFYTQPPTDIKIKWTAPEQLSITLINRTDKISQGSLNLITTKGTVTLAKPDFRLEFELPPNDQRTYTVAMKGAAITQTPWVVKGLLKYQYSVPGFCFFNSSVEREWQIYRKFWPIIPNGSLELADFRKDSPGKEYFSYSKAPDKMEAFPRNTPDYWWGIRYRQPIAGNPERGFQIVEHEGIANSRGIRLAPASSCPVYQVPVYLEKGQKYRFTLKMKWSSPSSGSYVTICGTDNENKTVSIGRICPPLTLEPDKWHEVTKEFTANFEQGNLHFYSGKNSTVWFDDLNIVPISNNN
jgi:hypothetical protein